MRPVFGITPPPEMVLPLPEGLALQCDLSALSVEQLEQRIEVLRQMVIAAVEADAFRQVEELDTARHEANTALHRRLRTKRLTCRCGAFLSEMPDEELSTAEGDNLDVWYCKRCGEEYRECY